MGSVGHHFGSSSGSVRFTRFGRFAWRLPPDVMIVQFEALRFIMIVQFEALASSRGGGCYKSVSVHCRAACIAVQPSWNNLNQAEMYLLKVMTYKQFCLFFSTAAIEYSGMGSISVIYCGWSWCSVHANTTYIYLFFKIVRKMQRMHFQCNYVTVKYPYSLLLIIIHIYTRILISLEYMNGI